MARSEDPPARNGWAAPPSFFQPNEIRSATDSDFQYFVQLADDRGDEWVKKLDKKNLTIWQKETGVSSIKMAKVRNLVQWLSCWVGVCSFPEQTLLVLSMCEKFTHLKSCSE